MSKTVRCRKRVSEPPHYLRHHQCPRPAVFRLVNPKSGQTTEACRQHAKQLQRMGWLVIAAARGEVTDGT